ncbi:MAG: hydrogenase maturation protease [bacterium]
MREVQRSLEKPGGLTTKEGALSGLPLLDLIIGYDRLVIVDAIVTTTKPAGYVHKLEMSQIGETAMACSPHFTGLPSMIKFGEACGYRMPTRVQVFAIEVKEPYTFGERLSPEVEEAVPRVARDIQRELWVSRCNGRRRLA